MSSSPRAAHGPFQMMGVWLFGGLSLVLGLGKLMGLWGGSWWWMALPILIFIVFNGFYIGMGFLYLTVQPVKERPAEEESHLLGRHRDGLSYGSGLVFVVGFVANLISRLEGVRSRIGGGWFQVGRRCWSCLACLQHLAYGYTGQGSVRFWDQKQTMTTFIERRVNDFIF